MDSAKIKAIENKKESTDAVRDEIVAQVIQKQNETDQTNKDSVQHIIDSLNGKLQAMFADNSAEEDFNLQKLQFMYAQKRTPGFHFFPVPSAKAAASFFENSDTLLVEASDGVFLFEHAYLNYLSKSKQLAAYTEPLADFWGPVRVSLGLLGLVPASKDSAIATKKSDSTFNRKVFQDRFKSGGGTVQLNFMYPLIHAHDSKYLDFKLYASPRFCIDVPHEDTSVQRFAHHTQVEAQLKIKTLNDNFNFLLCFRGLQAWGNSTFYDNMGFQGSDRKSFNFNTWTVGFIAKKQLAFYYTWYGGDSKILNQMGQANNNSITANFQF